MKAARAAGAAAPRAEEELTRGVQDDWIPKAAPIGWDRPSVTSEKRDLDRVSQRELGKVAMAFRLPGGEWLPVRLWDFSSIGFGVHWTPEPGGAGVKDFPFREGDEVLVAIRWRAQQRFEVWCQVKNVGPVGRGRPGGDGIKIGLRRLDVVAQHPVDTERRESFRLPLSPALALRARVKHPFLYGHVCPLKVSDMNRHLGVSFVSRDASILLFEGMELDLCYDLPGVRDLAMRGRVTWVHATQADEVRFGLDCADMDWRLHRALCNYLLYSRNWTPARLRDAGFKAQQVKGHLRFRTVKTMEDYAEVLRLRRDAYVSVGKRPAATTAEEMASPLDGISRILTARHNGVVVGSLTFAYPADENTRLDSQGGFPGGRYPIPLPPKTALIEVSRLCIREDYRGTDLLQGLFEHGLKHFLLSDRQWLLTSAVEELLPLYQSIGFRRLKASYRHPGLNHTEHHLIIAHKSAFLWGARLGLFVWNSVFGDLVRHLLDHRLIALPAWTRAIIRAKLLFRPLARKAHDERARRAFRKHLEALKNLKLGPRGIRRGEDAPQLAGIDAIP